MKLHWSTLAVISLLFLVVPLLAGCQPAEQVVSKFNYTIDAFGRKSVSVPRNYFLSPDRTRFAYYKYADDGMYVVVGKSEGKHYKSVDKFVFSPDSKRFAYIANGNMVVVDGVEGKTYRGLATGKSSTDASFNPIKFSADSKHVAYVALAVSNQTRHTKYIAVVDGIEHKPYDVVLDPTNLRSGPQAKTFQPPPAQPGVLFSPIEGRAVYVAGSANGERCLVVDGVEGKMYDGIYNVALSGDGQYIAYVARRDSLGEFSVVRDGIEGKWFQVREGVSDVSDVTLNYDGSTLAYAVQRLLPEQAYPEQFAVINEVEQPAYSEVSDITFSPDGKHLAYVCYDMQNGAVVILDGVPGDIYGNIGWRVLYSGGLIFSPDSQRLAYVAVPGHLIRTLVVDGIAGKQYSKITDATFGEDSQHVAYLANTYTAVSDGVETNYADIDGKPIFSKDARRSAAIVSSVSYRKAVAVDGVPGKFYDWVSSPVFSPDGQHIAYVVTLTKDKSFVVVDGIEGEEYDKILARDEPQESGADKAPEIAVVFDSDKAFHYLALFDDTILLVRGSVE